MADYLQLTQDIADWFARNDLPATSFISMAESELNRVMRLQAMEKSVTLTPSGVNERGLYIAEFPADYLELALINRNGMPLEYLSNDQLTSAVIGEHPDIRVYTIADGQFQFTEDTPVVLTYYASVPVLTPTNLTNYYTDFLYDALSYLSYFHASVYIGSPNPVYMEMANSYMRDAQQMDEVARSSGAPLVQRG